MIDTKRTPEMVALAKELHEGGASYGEIAPFLDVSPNTVRRWLDPGAAARAREHSLTYYRKTREAKSA